MAKSCLTSSSNNASNSGPEQQRQSPLPPLSKEESRFFFKRHPLSETLEPGGVQPVTGALISEARPIVLPGHSGKVKNNSTLHPVNPSEPVRNPPAHSGMPVKLSVIPSVSKLPLGGRIALFLSELAEHNKRPLGLGNCGGVQDRVSGIPPPDLHSQHACIRGGERFYRSRSAFSPSKTCHPQGSKTQWSRPEPVHKPLIHCSHKRGWAQASNKPQRLKPVCRVPAFQNGRCTNVKRSFKTKRLFNQDRPKGCLPYCFNMDPSPKIPAIHLEGHYVGVRMSSLWASQCSPHVLKVTKISCSPVKKNGNQTNYLPRRHAYHGRVQRLSHRTHHHCSQPVIQPQFCVKRGKVYSSTYSRIGVPWLSGEFSKNVFVPPKGQSKEYQEGVSESVKQPLRVYQNTVSTSGETVFFNPSSIPSTPALQVSFDGQTMALKKTQCYESTLLLNRAAQEELLWWRDHLAAWNGRSLLRKKDDLLIETDASNLGWGACCNGVRTGGIWSHRERLQHINCLELMAGGFAIKSFCKNRASIQVKLLMDNTTAIAYINRMGGLIPCSSQPSLRDLAVVPPKRDLSHSTPYPWHLQQCSRLGIQSGSRFHPTGNWTHQFLLASTSCGVH